MVGDTAGGCGERAEQRRLGQGDTSLNLPCGRAPSEKRGNARPAILFDYGVRDDGLTPRICPSPPPPRYSIDCVFLLLAWHNNLITKMIVAYMLYDHILQVSYLAGHTVFENANKVFGFAGWDSSILHLSVDYVSVRMRRFRWRYVARAVVRIELGGEEGRRLPLSRGRLVDAWKEQTVTVPIAWRRGEGSNPKKKRGGGAVSCIPFWDVA